MLDSTVESYIGAGAMIHVVNATADSDQSVKLRADHVSDILSVAGSVAGSKKLGIGAALDVETIDRTVKAYIDSTSASPTTVNAKDDVTISATSSLPMINIVAGITGSGKVGIAGSAAVIVVDGLTHASIGHSAVVSAGGDVSLASSSTFNSTMVAGTIAIAATGGFGASNTTMVFNDTVESLIADDAQITALGNGSAITVDTASADTRATDSNFHGLSVTAISDQDVLTIAAGAAGAGKVGVAGSAAVAVMNVATRASVASGVVINELDNAATGAGINIYASSDSTITDFGGAIAGGGSAGIGAGAGVVVLNKTTEAYFSPDEANAQGHVKVQALSDEKIIALAGNAGVGGSVGIAGGAAVVTLNLITRAYIGANAEVDADGSVVVAADDHTILDIIAGSISGAGSTSIGGAGAVAVVNKTTEAWIDDNAAVNARGGGSALTVHTGNFAAPTTTTDSTDSTEVKAPGGIADRTDQDDQSLTGQRSVAPLIDNAFRGLSVTATNRDDVESAGVSVGGAGTATIQLSASVNVLTSTVKAYIDDGAQINQVSNGSANALQTVRVAAGADFYHLGIAGAGGIAGTAAVTPAADVTVVTNTTEAFISDSAVVDAKRDVIVTAEAAEDILSIAAALAGSGTVGVAGSASVVLINNNTKAYIGQSADVEAGGNVVVASLDETDADLIAGSVAVGLGGGGAGGAVGVTIINKNTEAFIADDAVVNARANSSSVANVLDGSMDATGNFGTFNRQGVIIQAESSEDVFVVGASAGVGLFVGFAGAVSVTIIDSDTLAYVGSGAEVNTATSGENASQSVNVAAANDVRIFGVDGVISGALGGGLAGGVDVGIVRNDTSAFIADAATSDRTEVEARLDVGVHALANRDITTTTVSAAGGAVGIGGAVSVYSIGGNFTGSYAYDANNDGSTPASEQEDALSGTDGNFQSIVDGQTRPDSLISALSQYGVGGAFDPATDLSSNSIDFATTPDFETGDAVIYSKGASANTAVSGLVDGEVYYVIVDPSDPSKIQLAASRQDALAGNALTLSNGTGSGHRLDSLVGGASSRAGGSVNSSTPNNAVSGEVTQADPTEISAGTTAFIGINAQVTAGQHVDLDARERINIDVLAGGVGVGGSGFGAAIGIVNVNGHIEAEIRHGAIVSAGTVVSGGDVTRGPVGRR